jgi:hypothetical protein
MKQRMYFFVPYNLSPIQQGIQAGHAALEYAAKYHENQDFKDFIENDKTWIILNGGTTNDDVDNLGSLNKIYIDLLNHDAMITNETVNFSIFREPDLNNALTAVCFLVDERVWDYENYPDFYEWIINHEIDPAIKYSIDLKSSYVKRYSYEQFKESFPTFFNEWTEFLGGEKNVFLRELIKGKKLA